VRGERVADHVRPAPLHAGGDLDADGLEDVLIGAGYAGNASGAMYGIFGSPL
jgi:hypothetical protein